MDLSDALAFARDRCQGVLVTQRRDGRPQPSNIAYAVGDDGTIRISVTDGRAKTNNLRRTPIASPVAWPRRLRCWRMDRRCRSWTGPAEELEGLSPANGPVDADRI